MPPLDTPLLGKLVTINGIKDTHWSHYGKLVEPMPSEHTPTSGIDGECALAVDHDGKRYSVVRLPVRLVGTMGLQADGSVGNDDGRYVRLH